MIKHASSVSDIVVAERKSTKKRVCAVLFYRNILNKSFPLCVSIVIYITQFEPELPGLEGPWKTQTACSRQSDGRERHRINSVAQTNRVNGHRVGRGGSPLDLFFFFDTVGIKPGLIPVV